MTFTYSGDPASSRRDAVRFLLSDTDSENVLYQDAELDFLLSEWGNPYSAAIAAADSAAARFSREAQTSSKSVGDLSLSESFTDRANHYRALRSQLVALRDAKYPPTPWIDPESIRPTEEKSTAGIIADLWVGRFDNRENP